ncbi:hypothetical protein B5M09_011545 [Aphanomyces astaci]|uniref:MARVEL domain-containing protein n=2 Tax=Aphanomyces astaci TaxID=112090 RepID=A0A3R7Y585_APHAT|nr:hypothetical protein B5M09_011545 [Aphanomyces astaci]
MRTIFNHFNLKFVYSDVNDTILYLEDSSFPNILGTPQATMPDLNTITQHFSNKVVLARGGVLVSSLIAFFTSTGVTGISQGDYAFLISFITLSYVLLHFIFVTVQKTVSILPQTQLIIDGVLSILLLAGGIALAAFRWGLPGSGIAAVIFLFIATLFQAGVVALQVLEKNANNNSEPVAFVDTPADNYLKATTPVGEAPVVKDPEHSAV